VVLFFKLGCKNVSARQNYVFFIFEKSKKASRDEWTSAAFWAASDKSLHPQNPVPFSYLVVTS
jgi:hypothetical protein